MNALLPAEDPRAAAQSIAATEQAALGAAIRSPEAFDRVATALGPEDFTTHATELVFRAMSAMHDAGRTVDIVTLAAVLDRSEKWRSAEIGDAFTYVSALDERSASFLALDDYIGAIRSMSASRALIGCARRIEAVSALPLDADAKLAEAAAVVTELAQANHLADFVSARTAASEALAEALAVYERGGGLSGLSTGLRDLDEITGGLRRAHLYVLAARPSSAKTALAMFIAQHVARERPVHVFSLEMAAADLGQRMLCSLGQVDFGDFQRGKLDHVQQSQLIAAGEQIKQLDMRIDDHSGLSIEQIRARARMAARHSPPALIVVDFLTMIRLKGDNQTLEVGHAARGLKELAKELDCPVLCLAQLNRSVEQRPNKRPQLSDLRDSGMIEESADVVLFNYLDEKYNPDSERRGILELIVGKQRNGRTGPIFLDWHAHHQRFSNRDLAVPELGAEAAPSRGGKLRAIGGGEGEYRRREEARW